MSIVHVSLVLRNYYLLSLLERNNRTVVDPTLVAGYLRRRRPPNPAPRPDPEEMKPKKPQRTKLPRCKRPDKAKVTIQKIGKLYVGTIYPTEPKQDKQKASGKLPAVEQPDAQYPAKEEPAPINPEPRQ